MKKQITVLCLGILFGTSSFAGGRQGQGPGGSQAPDPGSTGGQCREFKITGDGDGSATRIWDTHHAAAGPGWEIFLNALLADAKSDALSKCDANMAKSEEEQEIAVMLAQYNCERKVTLQCDNYSITYQFGDWVDCGGTVGSCKVTKSSYAAGSPDPVTLKEEVSAFAHAHGDAAFSGACIETPKPDCNGVKPKPIVTPLPIDDSMHG